MLAWLRAPALALLLGLVLLAGSGRAGEAPASPAQSPSAADAGAGPDGADPADEAGAGEDGEDSPKSAEPPPEPTAIDRALATAVDDRQAAAVFLGYSLKRLILAAVILVLAFGVNIVLRHLLRRRVQQEDRAEEGDRRSLLGMALESGRTPLRVLVWALAIRLLGPTLQVDLATTVWVTDLVFSIAVALYIYNLVEIVEYYFARYAHRTDTSVDDALVPVVRKALRVLVVIIAALHIYNAATGQPITALLAGLGLGGLAFALAAQDTLKNLFGFAMILADRPFVVGERIDFDGHDGVVEAMGFRSVKVRRLDGHQVVVPNASAADHVIHNIGRRPYIKRVMNLGVTYDTPVEKVEKAVEIVREILDNHEGMDEELPPRVYFTEFNADNLGIMAIYWYHPPEYWDYLDFSQRVNLEIMRRFAAEGIDFAFPTQTIYLAGDPDRQLTLKLLNDDAARQGGGPA